MSLREYPYSQPNFQGYRENAPVPIELDSEARNAIIEAWDTFFTSEEPMSGVHMGILVRNLIELSAGTQNPDGMTESVIVNPGGDAEHIRFVHRASRFAPGGEATIEIVSNQEHGQTIELISWGRDLTSGRPNSFPTITRTHFVEGVKFQSLAAPVTDSVALTPRAMVQEPSCPYNLQTDGRQLMEKAFRYVARPLRKST